MSCTRCSKSHSYVEAFLLTCHDCARKWHHRCHIPPVSDQELIQRIMAYNRQDAVNGLQGWRCRRCVKRGTETPTPRTSMGPPSLPDVPTVSRSRSPSATHVAEPRRTTSTPPPSAMPPRSLPPLRPPAAAKAVVPPPITSDVPRVSSKRSVYAPNHRNDQLMSIGGDDEDGDAPSRPPSNAASNAPRGLPRKITKAKEGRGPGKALKSTGTKTVHPLAQEEEESSSSSAGPPSRPSQSNQSSSSLQKHGPQRPIYAANDDIALSHPSPPRKKRVSVRSRPLRTTTTLPPQPLSQQEKEAKREQFRQKAKEKEKERRGRKETRQRPQSRSEMITESVEGITSEVIDLTLSADDEPPIVVKPKQSLAPPQPRPSTPDARKTFEPAAPVSTHVMLTPGTVAGDKNTQKGFNLAPQWIHDRATDIDIWERALRKKSYPLPPNAVRRKFKAKPLGEIQPQLLRFSVTQWLDDLRGVRR